MNAAEITDKLGLHSLRNRNWYIQATCATSGDGLYEGKLDLFGNLAEVSNNPLHCDSRIRLAVEPAEERHSLRRPRSQF